MGNLRVSNEVILAKIESTYNTDPTPVAGTNAILVNSTPQFSAAGLRMQDRGAVRASVGTLQPIFGGQLGKLTFDVEIKGSGAAGTAPEIGPLLRACGMAETIVAVTSVTYKPRSSAYESITLYWYEGGRKQHKLTGARGDCQVKLSAGGIAMLSFEFTGHYTEPSDQTQPVPTYNSQVPKAALSMSITVGGVAVVAREWSIGLNNTIATPGSISASDGYSEVQITRRSVSGQMVIESELASVIDVDTQLKNGTGSTFASGTLGSTAGNRFAVSSATSGLIWTDRQFGEGDGLRLRTLPFQLVESSSNDDEVALAFT